MNSVNLQLNNPILSHNYNNSIMPVIKIDYNGVILYANMSSFDMLINLHCISSSKLPTHILSKIISGNNSVEINYKDKIVNFLIVPFPEAGFIGMYAFEIKSTSLCN